MGKENEPGTTYNVTEANHNHPPRVVYRYERLEAVWSEKTTKRDSIYIHNVYIQLVVIEQTRICND